MQKEIYVEHTGTTKYYGVNIDDVEYTVIETYDVNPDFSSYEVLRTDEQKVTKEEEKEVLEALNNWKFK